MENIKIGFIGTGNMGGALAKAAARYTASNIMLADKNEEKGIGTCCVHRCLCGRQ